MTDGYDCYQNAMAERINGILKDEFLLMTCADTAQLNKVIKQSIAIYNNKRPYLSLNCRS
jgi:putative transposase